MSESPAIGIIGAGKAGTAIARLALAAGCTVRIASSRSVPQTAMMTNIVAPAAVATDVADLANGTNIVVLALPLRRFTDLPLASLADRIVVDAMNYWPPVDGLLPMFEETQRPSSLVVRAALPPTVRLVKTFNHLGYHQIEDLARPAGAADRSALAVSGDDPVAVVAVADLVDRVGFDPVLAGDLAHSRAFQPGSAIFGDQLTAAEMRGLLAQSDQREEAA
jgi:predicted dinucleotide-binding enzyme